MSAKTDELTNAVHSVVETFQPYRADHRRDRADYDRWLIWNDQTSERLGTVALGGPHDTPCPLCEKKGAGSFTGDRPFAQCRISSRPFPGGELARANQ
jgi:hypothetical protein